MKDLNQSRLASLLALLVGVWVVISPAWVSMSSGAQASTIVTGLVIIAASIVQYFVTSSIPSWISAIAAAWLFVSIFVYSFDSAAIWSQVLSAIAVVALSIWDGVEVEHFAHRHANHQMPTM